MSKIILFSPIGGTDPIKNHADGSMLHICRYYKPDVIYLYLSHEIMICHKKDDRYVDAIKRLGVHLNHSFDIRLIERNELVNVQKYDIFYEDFKKEIKKIEQGMEKNDKLLINVSSGTPAMKSALQVMSILAEYRFQPIQVRTPRNGMNKSPHERDDYDIEENWRSNKDNTTNDNRCDEIQCPNLIRLLKIETIKKHIGAYDYSAALSVAEELKDDISNDAYLLLKIADARIKLNLHEIDILMDKCKSKFDIYPIKEDNKKEIFEYALGLQIKILKQEYADFVRAITPLTVDLLERILKQKCGISLSDCCRKKYEWDKKTGKKNKEKWRWQWDKNRLQEMNLLQPLNDAYYGNFTGKDVYSTHLKHLILSRCDNPTLKKKVTEIVMIDGVRNTPAHEIISVTEQWLKRETGKTAQEIMEVIKYLIIQAGINVKNEYWQSYDKMNQEIEALLR